MELSAKEAILLRVLVEANRPLSGPDVVAAAGPQIMGAATYNLLYDLKKRGLVYTYTELVEQRLWQVTLAGIDALRAHAEAAP